MGCKLAPTKPKLLFVASCYSGFASASSALFSEIPSLDVVIGSPGPITIDQAAPGIAEFSHAARRREFPDIFKAFAYVLGPLVTKGVLYRQTRAGHTQNSPLEQALQDVAGLLLPQLLK